jgi:hypothetical protein
VHILAKKGKKYLFAFVAYTGVFSVKPIHAVINFIGITCPLTVENKNSSQKNSLFRMAYSSQENYH